MGLREDFLDGSSPVKPVDGTKFYVRVMTGRASDKFSALIENKGTPNSLIMATLIRYAACDSSGELLFNDDDVEKLRDARLPELKRVFDAAMEVNAVGKNEVEGLEKN